MKAFRLFCHALALLVVAGLAFVWIKTRAVEYLVTRGFNRGGSIELFALEGRLMVQYSGFRSSQSDWTVEAVDVPTVCISSEQSLGRFSLRESEGYWHWSTRRIPNPPRRRGPGGRGC